MFMRGIDILKMASKQKEGEIEFTYYYNKKIKKNKKHNDIVMNLLSVLDNTEHTITAGEKTKDTIKLILKHDAINYIVKYFGL